MNKVTFVKPVHTLSVSLTGKECYLDCAYCNKHYLSHMKRIEDINTDNCNSVLVSGGMTSAGYVPFMDNVDSLLKLKNNNIRLNIHSGILKEENDFIKLKQIADCVSFDIVIEKNTIKRIYGDFFTSQDFKNTFEGFLKHNIKVVPHVMIGINEGKICGETEVIDYLYKKTDNIVFLVLIPNKNTEFAEFDPPDILEVIKVLEYAKERFSDISLGCMRPGGKYRRELDTKALKIGIDKIVMPSGECEEYAEKNNFVIEYKYECCVF